MVKKHKVERGQNNSHIYTYITARTCGQTISTVGLDSCMVHTILSCTSPDLVHVWVHTNCSMIDLY